MMENQLPKVYEPQNVESKIYDMWLENDCFKAEADPEKKPFCIVMPPPNVTGQLHMGHAMDATMQDVLIRFKRMQGYSALWLPGTDHAGIATQIKVEEELRKEGLTRYDLGREKFLEKVWDWKNKYGTRIQLQQRKLGASCDWSRSRFTMDEGCSNAVREVFVNLYEKGLIYKGSRIINWCPNCITALSDAEVEYVDKPGHLWYIRYPLSDGSGEVVVATTRPETMLGDTGVAVNPNDERYASMVGKTCILPLVNKEIPIVADEYVEMEFGTGCVKMTPAHDPNDFEVGLRHHLEVIRVLDDNGCVSFEGKYNGMDRYEARKLIVEDLEAGGYLVKVEPYSHNVGTCYRCHNDVEPIISAQWFVKMEPLAKPAIEVVKSGELKFVPERFSKNYINWMENLHDWCISRQLWWGHQIPAWTCEDCGEITVSREDPTECAHCGSKHIERDPDVLDTWFSSALWPFETLGWPEKTKDLDYFYPTDVLVTGYDIITFWVSRMIFSGLEQMKEKPFHTVLIHGLVRDDKGRKMSKSLGNGIDPLEMIDNYGADALRMNMLTGNSPGNDMRFYVERCEAMRNFANKIWNASRYVLMNLTIDRNELPPVERLENEDKWILSKLNALISEATENMERYELGVAVQKIYDFIWDSYCDWYIELTKARLYADDEESKRTAQQVLVYVLEQVLRLLHPFMPFITEEIWQAIPHDGAFLITSSWPVANPDLDFPKEESEMESVMDAIRAVRNRRAEMNVPPSRKSTLYIVTDSADAYRDGEAFLMKLAYADQIILSASAPEGHEDMVEVVTHDVRMYLPMDQLIDREQELQRIAKELKNAQGELQRIAGKLGNPGFLAKAPESVVAGEREKQEKLNRLVEQLTASQARLMK